MKEKLNIFNCTINYILSQISPIVMATTAPKKLVLKLKEKKISDSPLILKTAEDKDKNIKDEDIKDKEKEKDHEEWIDLTANLNASGASSAENPNQKLIEILHQLVNQVMEENRVEKDKKAKTTNKFRIKAMNDAIQIIKDHPIKITSGADAKQLKGIGSGMADRIDEILSTGTLKELEDKVTEETTAIKSLSTILGVGDAHASVWFNKYKIKSAEELMNLWKNSLLKDMDIKLTHQMEVGLRYYKDFQIKIPRDEISEIRKLIEVSLKTIDKKLIFEICGSNRRGKDFSGDVDILVTHPAFVTNEELINNPINYLNEIVSKLVGSGFLIDYLTEDSYTKYMGVCRIRELARRIDIRVVPFESWASALMYFTGSGEFNIQFRRIALKKGYTLTEYGLYKLVNGLKGPMVPDLKTEKDIFDFLRVKYLTPAQRNI